MIAINLRGSFFVGKMAIGLIEGTVEVPARLIMTASDMAYCRLQFRAENRFTHFLELSED